MSKFIFLALVSVLLACAASGAITSRTNELLNGRFARMSTEFASKVETQVNAAVELAKAGKVAERATNAECNAATTCGACIAITGCVWTPVSFNTIAFDQATNQATGAFGLRGECWPGSADGPVTTGAGLPEFFQLFGDGNDEPIYAFWGAGVAACDAVSVVAKVESSGTQYEGNAFRFALEFQSSFGVEIPLDTILNIYKDDSLSMDAKQKRLLALFYEGFGKINVYIQIILAHARNDPNDATDYNKAGFAVVFVGFNFGQLFRQIVEGTQVDFFNGPKATAFIVFFDELYQYTRSAAGTGITLSEASGTGVVIESLLLATVSTTQMGNSMVSRYSMSGDLSDGTNFAMYCYFGTRDFQHLNRTINANTFECDLDLTSRPVEATKANAVGVMIIGFGFSVLSDALNQQVVNIGNGGSFEVMDTATCAGTTCDVITLQDNDCTTVSWLTNDLRTGLQNAFRGSLSPICRVYSFDAVNNANVFWDPSGGVNPAAAKSSIDNQINASTSPAGVAFPILALIAALAAFAGLML